MRVSYFRPKPELDWQLSGKCFGDDPEKWNADSLNPLWPEREAKQLCEGCPVRNECYLDALRIFSNSAYAGFPGEWESELQTNGVVRAGRVF